MYRWCRCRNHRRTKYRCTNYTAEVVEIVVANVTVADDVCADAQKELEAEKDALVKIALKLDCELACSEDPDANCGNDVSDECAEAQKEYEAEENSIAKAVLKTACIAACSEDPDATCGFLVNGVSMILFAVLAMLKQ